MLSNSFIKFCFFIVITLITVKNGKGQAWVGHIPEQDRIDWTKAGLESSVPHLANYIFFVDDMLGNDDHERLNTAISKVVALNNSDLKVIKFSANKTYQFNTEIVLDGPIYSNIVFQGEGSSTVLNFDGIYKETPCFTIKGNTTGISSTLTNPIFKKAFELELENQSELTDYSVGDWVHFYERSYPVKNVSSYSTIVGQITKVTSKTSSELIVQNEAARNYDITASTSGDKLLVRKLDPIKRVGFENFKIQRSNSDDGNGGSTFVFNYAVNCWVKGVESQKSSEFHFVAKMCSNLEVSGCFFSHAYSYGAGGRGYGVNLKQSTSNCEIENNIFNTLRHAVVIEMGANSNAIQMQ